MASLVLGAAGAAVGSMFGMPQVGWMIGSTIGGMMTSLPDVKGPQISDLRVQVSTYGIMRPIFYGTARAAGNVIWSSDLIETATTQSAGGKGGPSQDVTTYSYSVNCAVAIGEGPISGVRKIWANGILIYDASTTNTGITGQSDNIRVYLGDETQVADSLIESYLGVGNVPAYRGTPYVVFENFQLANYGNRIPNFAFEVVQDGTVVSGNTVVMNSGDSYSYMIEHPYRDGVMLALLNKAPSGVGIDELHVLDYVNNTVQVISLGIDNANEIIYVPTTDEIWIATNSWNSSISNYDVALRLAAQTLAIIGTVSTPHDGTWGIRSPGHILYDSTFDQVWFLTSGSTVASGVNVMNPHDYSYVSGGVLSGISNLWFTANATMGDSRLAAGESGGGIFIFGDKSFIRKIPTLTTNPYPVWYDSSRKRFFFYYDIQTIRVIDELTLTTTDYATTVSNYSSYAGVTMAYHEVYDKVFLTEQSASSVYTLYQLNADTFAVENSWTIFQTNYAPGITQLKLTPEYVGLIRANGSGDPTSAVLFPIVPRLTSNQVALSAVVSDLCDRVNLVAADIDVTQLTDMVDGYVISQQSTARTAIENLMTVYYFDAVESQL